MGFSWSDIGKTAATGGLYAGYKGARSVFGGGYDTAAAGARRAGGEYDSLADEQRGYYENAANRAQGYYDRAGSAYDSIYGAGGAGAGPSFSESFYGEMSGKDPFAFERAQSASRVNAAAAAGGYGGKALAAHGLGEAAFDSDLMKHRGNLAGQADQAKQQRLGGQFGAAMGLGGAQAGLAMQGAGMAGGAYGQAKEGGINARNNAAQLSGQAENAAWSGLMDLGKAVGSMATGNPAGMASMQGAAPMAGAGGPQYRTMQAPPNYQLQFGGGGMDPFAYKPRGGWMTGG